MFEFGFGLIKLVVALVLLILLYAVSFAATAAAMSAVVWLIALPFGGIAIIPMFWACFVLVIFFHLLSKALD